MGRCIEQRQRFYEAAIHLHFVEGLGHKRISKIIPVSPNTIRSWILTFAREKGISHLVRKQKMVKSVCDKSGSPSAKPSGRSKDEEIVLLRRQLREAEVKAAANVEMIEVAEKKFGISIRKKAGAKR